MLAGLDIGATFHVLYSPRTNTFHRIPAEQIDKIVDILRRDGLEGVVIEPTGSWSVPVIEWLYKAGAQVYTVHTTRFRRYAAVSDEKTDKNDARLLAEYAHDAREKRDAKRKLVLFKVDDAYIESRQVWKLWKEREALTKFKTNKERQESQDVSQASLHVRDEIACKERGGVDQVLHLAAGKNRGWEESHMADESKIVNIYGVSKNGPYDKEKVKKLVDDEMYEIAKRMLKGKKKNSRKKMKDDIEYKEERGEAPSLRAEEKPQAH